jgi:phosphoribosylformimino-5-aminoimidazole carboxamide ribotide isomerase
MLIIPAIDLLENKAVRLYKGDYSKVTVYSESPWEWMPIWKSYGAKLIHIVDLDGAKSGKPVHANLIEKMIKTAGGGIEIEVGGGIRSIDQIQSYLDSGVSRLIIGTQAIKNPEFLMKSLSMYGSSKIILGVDVKEGDIKISGWEEGASLPYLPFLQKMEKSGVEEVIVTDIQKDGTLSGPSVSLYEEILQNTNLELIASGGVSSMEDLQILQKISSRPIKGAITGKAIYEGKLDIHKALWEFNKKG